MPWTKHSAVTLGWQQLSAFTDAGNDVDFVMRVDDQYPLQVNNSRPVFIINDVETP